MASGKYDLLVSLKSDVGQYKKNMAGAKAATRNFANSASSSFAMSNTAAGRFIQTFSRGRGVIASMIPAINGVKAALVATGIGAILVGIGVAVASVNSYINNTVEGSHKWKEAWSRVTAVGEVLKDRLADIGKGVVTMFKNFKEGDRMISGAFMGIFKEIKEETAATVELQKRENALWRDKLDFSVKEAKTQAKIRDLILEGNRDRNSSLQKEKYLTEAMALQTQISGEKKRLADEELDIQERRMALGHNSTDDEEKLVELKVKSFQVDDERLKVLKKINEQLETNRIKLNDAEKIQAKMLRDAESIAEVYAMAFKPAADDIDAMIDNYLKLSDLPPLDNFTPEAPDQEEYQGLGGQFKDLNNILSLTQSGLFAVENAFAQVGETGKMSVKDLMSTVINATGRIIQAYLAEAIAGMIKSGAVKGLPGLIMAGVGIGGLMALWNTAIPQFAAGGIVTGPTVGMMGEYAGARNNPEVIAPLNKLRSMIGAQGISGHLDADGTKLIAVIESTENRNKMFG